MSLSPLVFFILSVINSDKIDNSRYPIYWNVDETEQPSINLSQFQILPRNYTQCGNQCSTPNCQSWTQGKFPTITDDGTPINGGVPQNSNLTDHLLTLKSQIINWIPNIDWSGNAVFDFEAWTTIWDLNDNSGNWHGKRYQNYSIYLVKQKYPNWNETQIENEAKKEFENAATQWFVETIKACKEVRPNARFGFYGLPLNLNNPCIMGSNDEMLCGYNNPQIAAKYKGYSDQQIPIWNVSDIIYPSIYLPGGNGYTYQHNIAIINSTVTESLRCANNGKREINGKIFTPMVFPYMMQLYHNGTTYLNINDSQICFTVPYNLGSQGIVIWGGGSTSWPNKNITQMWVYANQTTGPVVNQTEYNVDQCSQKYCNNHGKCSSFNDHTCICDVGYNPPNCT